MAFCQMHPLVNICTVYYDLVIRQLAGEINSFIFLFLRQTKITLFIFLLIAQIWK